MPGLAQVPRPRDSNALGWYAYIGRHRLAKDWDLHLEGQWRRSDVILRWQQLLIRPALIYKHQPAMVRGRWIRLQSYLSLRRVP
jgi:hypothetical protein